MANLVLNTVLGDVQARGQALLELGSHFVVLQDERVQVLRSAQLELVNLVLTLLGLLDLLLGRRALNLGRLDQRGLDPRGGRVLAAGELEELLDLRNLLGLHKQKEVRRCSSLCVPFIS